MLFGAVARDHVKSLVRENASHLEVIVPIGEHVVRQDRIVTNEEAQALDQGMASVWGFGRHDERFQGDIHSRRLSHQGPLQY
eukprot:SAG31_NODE_12720_length_921_cov_2.321168_1_plen_82_part_00